MGVENPDMFRTKIREKFQQYFSTPSHAINIEKGIFNHTIKECRNRKLIKKWDNPNFVLLYTDRVRTLLNNIDKSDIVSKIENKEITPQMFAAEMTHQEMDPQHWKPLIDKKSMLDASKFDTELVANTDMFTCGKCRSKNCNYYTLQTRSADEPETIFITCLDCGKNWKR
jgi:DNA-directed RNA polymerase subunit M/transcription elongation factor TFIIS